MKINLTSADPINLKTDCLVVGILDGGKLTASAKKADKSMGGIIQRRAYRRVGQSPRIRCCRI